MTINMTKDPRSDAKPDPASEPSTTGKTNPGLGVAQASAEPDVEGRIKLRRAELVARLRELRADARIEATEAGDKLKAKLSEIAHIIKEGVVDGWSSIGDNVKHKLERWLAESARQLPPQDAAAKPAAAAAAPAAAATPAAAPAAAPAADAAPKAGQP